ncbi:pyridoxine biosynthesis protein [Coemansia sp. RSA 1365]|nr:pyridoxine biosynthesis protein [Coemansia sp. RSA 1365]
MPALSPTMTQGGIARWEKKEGESFAAGDLLLQIETDKAQMDVEAQDDGVLVKIIAPEGTQNVAINSSIAIIAEEGDDIRSIDVDAILKGTQAKSSASSSAAAESILATPPASETKAKTAHADNLQKPDSKAQGLLSPAATFAIHSNHIANSKDIRGSGPKGRILKGDVLRFLKDGKAVVDKTAATQSASAPSPRPAGKDSSAAASQKSQQQIQPSADSEAAFLVQALEPSVLRRLAAQELARKSTTVQVPADKLAKVLKSNKTLNTTVFAVRAAALALHQAPLRKDSNASVGIAVEGSKTPTIVEIPDAATTSVIDLATAIKAAQKAGQPAEHLPAVVLASEGLYTPSTLPNAAVVVVGAQYTVVSASEASVGLGNTLDDLIGGSVRPESPPAQKPATAIDMSVISDSSAAPLFAAKLKGFLSNPELLSF